MPAKQKFNLKYILIVLILAIVVGTILSIMIRYTNEQMNALSTYSDLNWRNTKNEIKHSNLISCQIDADCACGKKIGTNECFFGNKKYVNTLSQCPDFCSGIDGGMTIKCQSNQCAQVREKYY